MKQQLTPYYIATAYDRKLYTAGIVRFHQDKIMDERGYTALRFNNKSYKGLLAKCMRIQQCILIAFSIPKKSIVYFHFPFPAAIQIVLLRLFKWRGIKTAALIIDIDGLRDKNEGLIKKEIFQLSKFTYVVAHNEEMKRWLVQQLPSTIIFSIIVFDYAYSGEAISYKKLYYPKLSNIICFAGNILKATFVYKWHSILPLQLYVYGVGYNALFNIKDGFIYKGTAPPDELPFVIEGSFGLVWDGDDMYNCDLYLKYNNPHKLSLYLAAGMPVIVWDKSAVSGWVKQNNIGFCISSIADIGNRISNISIKEYYVMHENAAAIGKRICDGYYLKAVLKDIENID